MILRKKGKAVSIVEVHVNSELVKEARMLQINAAFEDLTLAAPRAKGAGLLLLSARYLLSRRVSSRSKPALFARGAASVRSSESGNYGNCER